MFKGEPCFDPNIDSIGNNLDKDVLFTNLLYHFTEPFDVVCDFTERSSEACKTCYRRYFPCSEPITKTPKLIIICSRDEHLE